MEIDILIDRITDCLIDNRTGEKIETKYKLHESPMQKKEYKNWRFDWSEPQKKGYDIYELFLKNNDDVQGRIAVKIDGGVADVDIAETAPHNYGHTGIYDGVGAHLFAIACQISVENGCDGFVAFTAKSSLVEYYMKSLNAKVFQDRRMYIDEAAAKILLDKYIRK